MQFHLPFDDAQRNDAAKRYNDLRRYLSQLRDRYPPRSRTERAILRTCRRINQDFARELLKPRGRISPTRLNELSQAFTFAVVEYMNAKRH